jgi:uncharacterized protein YdeI (YjbR/CyaY-like superfamily)
MKELHSEGLEIRSFKRQKDWDAWLYKNHSKSPGIWIRIAKKASSDRSITYAESLETALCYGWIDGQKRSEGEASWLQKFTRRTKTSLWSKVNREKVIALTEAGAMKPAGLLEVGRAKESGRWDAAYDSPRNSEVPADFQAALNENAVARANFLALDRVNRYLFLFRIQTARKAELRSKRIAEFLRMLENNEKFHP